jgi:hypothetical protein
MCVAPRSAELIVGATPKHSSSRYWLWQLAFTLPLRKQM